MSKKNSSNLSRRSFLQVSAASAGTAALVGPKIASAADEHRNYRPDIMPYRTLGRTGIKASRLVFGCGAALAGGKAVHLLEHAYEAGVNYFDVGSRDYYRGSETHLAPFVKRHNGDVWVASKGYARSGVELDPKKGVTVEFAKSAADFWLRLVEGSLTDLSTDHIDAYYVQGSEEPDLVKSEELGNAFRKVKDEGKVRFIGVSTHKNAEAVLARAVETGWYDIAMLAITPAGWYDWRNREMLKGSPPLKDLRPQLDSAREAGLGLIGMKCARLISSEATAGSGDTTAFDDHYSADFMKASLTPFQRSYAYVLEHGLDLVNSDMQNVKHYGENLIAATTSGTYFA